MHRASVDCKVEQQVDRLGVEITAPQGVRPGRTALSSDQAPNVAWES
jgi:hypothetical protein